MTGTRYNLTVRREDVLELYENQFHFNWKSHEVRRHIFYLVFCLIGLVLTWINVFHLNDRTIAFLFCSIGALYNVVILFKAYRNPSRIRKNINDWVDAFSRYKEHWIVMGENSFTYYRDTEVHRYDLCKIEKKYHDSNFFNLKTTGGEKIILPAKSFEPGKYAQFVNEVDAVIKRCEPEQAKS